MCEGKVAKSSITCRSYRVLAGMVQTYIVFARAVILINKSINNWDMQKIPKKLKEEAKT